MFKIKPPDSTHFSLPADFRISNRVMAFALKEINGDLFSAKTSMAHCVGADLKMGMGIAVKFKQLFGGEAELRKQNVKTGGCAVLPSEGRFIYYLVTKDKSGNGHFPTYESLESSLAAMRDHMVKNNVTELAIPQIGCGIDGLKWEKVDETLRRVFQDTNCEITVYKYVPPK